MAHRKVEVLAEPRAQRGTARSSFDVSPVSVVGVVVGDDKALCWRRRNRGHGARRRRGRRCHRRLGVLVDCKIDAMNAARSGAGGRRLLRRRNRGRRRRWNICDGCLLDRRRTVGNSEDRLGRLRALRRVRLERLQRRARSAGDGRTWRRRSRRSPNARCCTLHVALATRQPKQRRHFSIFKFKKKNTDFSNFLNQPIKFRPVQRRAPSMCGLPPQCRPLRSFRASAS